MGRLSAGLASLLMLTLLTPIFASDIAKEQRWADQVVDSILDGEPIWLEADGQQFLSIYTPAEEDSGKGLIVMHGTGVHPNWNQVIQPIRVEMTSRGWNTLSIQMPILPNEASHEDYAPLFPEVPPRIEAAVSYLQSQGSQNIVLVAHSLGSLMTSYYLSKEPSGLVKGFVAIGMTGGAKHADMNSLNTLKSVRVPTLDLYGSADLPNVLSQVQAKKQAASNITFDQLKVEGANHFFDDKNEALIGAVNDWLEKRF